MIWVPRSRQGVPENLDAPRRLWQSCDGISRGGNGRVAEGYFVGDFRGGEMEQCVTDDQIMTLKTRHKKGYQRI